MEVASLEIARDKFNERRDAPRLVSLLSPTCLVCQYGQGVVRTVFEVASDAQIFGLIAWIPMMDADSEEAAAFEVEDFDDPRVHHLWDGQRSLGNAFARTLRLQGPAWDVYLLYEVGVEWTGTTPPKPSFWQHQLPSSTQAEPAQLLHAGRFALKINELLGKDPKEVPVDAALFLHAKGLSTVKAERQHSQPKLEEVAKVATTTNHQTDDGGDTQ